MKKLYLIQRGTINRPLGEHKGLKLSAAVDLDYMGSSEFEFGALPASFASMFIHRDGYKLKKTERITKQVGEHQFALRVYHNMEEKDFNDYVEQLVHLRNGTGNLYLKERTYFELGSTFFGKFDFWWDIENHVIFSFDKHFMNRLPSHLKASFTVMEFFEDNENAVNLARR